MILFVGMFHIREAEAEDIEQLIPIRLAVKENVLSEPAKITALDYHEFLLQRGKGWVCEAQGLIQGFAVVDIRESNVWALFVHPNWEGMGIGKALQNTMLQWYFNQGYKSLWLSTQANSRAQKFYESTGWRQTGITKSGEIRFEMDAIFWQASKR